MTHNRTDEFLLDLTDKSNGLTLPPATDDKLTYKPLATRMRARCLGEIVGQRHILGEHALLPRLVRGNHFGSLLFYGPPGCGKTTLAEVIALETKSRFVRVNAVMSNVAELREILKVARYYKNERTILFIDEIHRFNKAQQDLLLPDVEEGVVRLIGATTQNPTFYLNAPLLSRSHLFRLEPLSVEELQAALRNALDDAERGLAGYKVSALDEMLMTIARFSEGDLRRALNALETLVMSLPVGSMISGEVLNAFFQERQIRYDRNEDEHYDTISAFIKSVRGCDPDAALYWLAKMLEGGEDPRFIARRLVILASEDIGLADPRGLPLAVAAFNACEILGMPECRLSLAHATLFLATAPKSNSAYMALEKAQQSLREQPVQSVPLWLRDGSTSISRNLGNGKSYLYSHEFEDAISGQEYMMEPIKFYDPKNVGAEVAIAERLQHWRQIKKQRAKK
jgi:putative ATPase